MSTRSIEIRMRANVSGFTAEMAKARQSLDEVVKAADKNAQVADTAGGRMVQSARLQADEWSAVGNTLLGVGAVGTAAFGGMVKTAASFEQQMSAVQAATLAGSGEMEQLSEAAKQAGADTAFSATEAAQGIEALAKAGVSTSDILGGGLKGALDLAAAGGISVQEASESAANALTQFSLSGEDVPHVADLLAAAAGKAQGGVTEMSQALSQAGLVASNSGLSIEETVGTLAAFASAGLLGSDAGTSFKSMLQRLQNPSKESAALMKDLGLSLYDTNGNMVGMSNLAGQLQTKLSGMSQAQRDAAFAQIFGSDAVRAANVLYSEGAAGISQWTENVNQAGYASETAAARQDNLAGSWEKFTGSMETLAISVGELVLPALTGLVDKATSVVDAVSGLPTPVLAVGAGLGGIVSVATLAGGAFFKLAPSVMQTWTAFGNLANTIPGVSKILGAVSGPAAAAGKGLLALTKWGGIPVAATATVGTLTKSLLEATGVIDRTVQSTEELTNSLINAGQGGKTFYDSIISPIGDVSTTQFSNLAESFERISRVSVADRFAGMASFLDATGFREVSEQMEVLDQQMSSLAQTDLSAATAQFKSMFEEAGGGPEVFMDMMNVLPGYKDALMAAANAAGVQVDETELVKLATGEMNGELGLTQAAADGAATGIMGVADGMEEATSTTDQAADAMKEYLDILANYAALNMSADEASLNYMDTLNGLPDAYDQASEGVTDLNELDLIRKTLLGDLAKASQSQIDAMHQQIDAEGNLIYSSAEIGAQASSNVDDFIAQAQAMGLSADAAVDLASNYGMLPADVNTVAEFDKWKAEQDAADWAGVLTTEDGKTVLATAEFDTAKARSDAIMLTGDYEPLQGSLVSTAYFEPGEAIPKVQGYKQELGFIPPEARTDGVFVFGAAKAGVDSYKTGSLGTIPKTTDTTPRFLSAAATGATNVYKGNLNTIPGAKNTNLNVRDNGSWTIQSVKNGLASVNDKTVTLTVNRVENAVKGLFGKAYGGPIYGPGTGTSDDVPIMASHGEYMIRETAARKNRRLLDMINYGGFDAQSALGLAEGGPVDRSTMTPARLMVPFATKAVSQPISLDGMRVTGTLDLGDGLEARMDARINSHDRMLASVGRTGR